MASHTRLITCSGTLGCVGLVIEVIQVIQVQVMGTCGRVNTSQAVGNWHLANSALMGRPFFGSNSVCVCYMG